MFERARLKLTARYLLIIMAVSVMFSIAFYHASTREIERVITKIQTLQGYPNNQKADQKQLESNFGPTLVYLEASKKEILIFLYFVNAWIFFFAGLAGYFLAGKTLHPIKVMIEEQNQFVSSASHELRTPIATLRAEMEGSLLERHISDKEARKLIKSNLEELGTLQALTNNLLQLAQIHNIHLKEKMQIVSLSKIISTAQKKVNSLAKSKNIKIINKSKDNKIHGDSATLTEVFVTILDNAIKYSPSKTKINISSIQKRNSVKINITDQGKGISPTDLPHIFDRFYRADNSRSQTEGYGLGLSIAKKIIEKHNGTIAVKSTEGRGSTFTIAIPKHSS